MTIHWITSQTMISDQQLQQHLGTYKPGNLWVQHQTPYSEAYRVTCVLTSLSDLLKSEIHSTSGRCIFISIYFGTPMFWKIFICPSLVISRSWLKMILLCFRFETTVGFLLYLILHKADVFILSFRIDESASGPPWPFPKVQSLQCLGKVNFLKKLHH